MIFLLSSLKKIKGNERVMIYILLIFELLLLSMTYIFANRDLLSPSVFMCVMYIVSTIFMILNYSKWSAGREYNVYAIIIIVTGILVFMAGEMLYRFCLRNIRIVLKKKGKRAIVDGEIVKSVIDVKVGFLVAAIVVEIMIIAAYYRQILDIAGGSGFEVFVIYRRLGISRMASGDISSLGIVSQLMDILTAAGYVGEYILVNNFVYKDKNKKRTVLLSLLVLLGAASSVMSAGRTQMLMYVAAFIIYYWILWNQKNDWKKNLSWKFIRIGMVLLLIGIPVFYNMLSLLGRTTGSTNALEQASVYLGSSIFLFSEYLYSPTGEPVMWGEESLYGVRKILAVLGLGEVSTSYNLEFRQVGTGHSNVYGFFRRPLHDFGIVGMYVFVFIIALFFAWLYHGHIKGRKNNLKTRRWVMIYGYLFYWIFISSISQYSANLISFGAVKKIIAILLINWLMNVNCRRTQTSREKCKRINLEMT